MSVGTIIVGASHAGVQVAASLRDSGYDKPITIFDSDSALPYQRPPLSKDYLKKALSDESLALRGESFYSQRNIVLNLGCEVTKIDRDSQTISFTQPNSTEEEQFPYENLVLALGARARELPDMHSSSGAMTLRNLNDAKRLNSALISAHRVVIIGSGFIGLEVASTAAQLGTEVTVVERDSRVLQRILPPVLSGFIESRHRLEGTEFMFDADVEHIKRLENKDIELTLKGGAKVTGDLLLVGVGAVVNDQIAKNAGLKCSNGVLVTEYGETSDSAIYACGDCARVVMPDGVEMHVESVQNAVDQGKNVAALIAGSPVKKPVAPWFWSDQLGFKLQMVGDTLDYNDLVIRGDKSEGKFSVLYYRDEVVVRVDSINQPGDHLAARKLVSQGVKVPKDVAADTAVRLKSFV